MYEHEGEDDLSDETHRMMYDALDELLRTMPFEDAVEAIVEDMRNQEHWEYDATNGELVSAAIEEGTSVIQSKKNAVAIRVLEDLENA